ncbi:MAG: hypothetical protein GY851_12785 [bacterium]|nr:hypothetical protein [bacterium]
MALFTPKGGADMISYTFRTTDGGKILLTSVTVDREDGPVVYDAARLIPATLTHFASATTNTVAMPSGSDAPTAAQRRHLLGPVLNEGLLNPAGGPEPLRGSPVIQGDHLTPGMAIAFAEPVENLPGDDVVFFELQRRINSPLAGDPVHVVPLVFRDGLRPITISEYDIQFEDPKAVELDPFEAFSTSGPPGSLAAFESTPLKRGSSNSDFKVLAVGIDLSDLGYGDGERVEGLFFQNAGVGGPCVDPVCIAGLPSPKSPNTLEAEPKTPRHPGGLTLEGMLDGPMARVDEIVFAVRAGGTDHWYANFGYYSAPNREYPPQRAPDGVVLPAIFKAGGGRLCMLNPRTGDVRTLLDDTNGAMRDPFVHYEGDRILFSYRKDGSPYYHLYEINRDGSGLTQLTDGPYNDIEPTYLPDDGIMFCSDRCRRFVNCWISPVATLYRCNGDGTGIRTVSTNIEHDNTPWVLPDGRVLYMRWEYVDRSQSHFHHLWTTNPDGTAQMVYYGNQNPGVTMIDAKPIPDGHTIVASFSPGHGRPEHDGHITVVNPALGPDSKQSAKRISKGGPVFRDPYPLSEKCFLVARGKEILAMNGAGTTYPLYALPSDEGPLTCHEPRPVVSRKPEPVIPPRSNPSKPTGTLFLTDIYHGRSMEGVPRGSVKELLVLEQLPKPVNFSGGMWPISIGGTFTLARILGTVPVNPDGSAHFEVPAMRSLFFVALDEAGLSVKRMQSFLTVMPGETTSCVGCHEPRTNTPPSGAALLQAMHTPPSTIKPVAHVSDVMDFARDIQPILDKYCVKCHNPERYAGRADFTGDHSPLFSQSYWTITQRGLAVDGRNEPKGNRPPYTIGSSASPLMKKIAGGHNDVRVTAEERDRIRLWIDSSAPYAGTYAALGSGLFPVEFPAELMERRCGECHSSDPPAQRPIGKHRYFQFGDKGRALPLVHTLMDLQYIRAYMGYYKYNTGRTPQSLWNLTRPEMSLLLRAPLAKDAGGLALCEGEVFVSRDDPDYQAMLAAVDNAARKHDVEKRFDMAGFRPNDYYIHQMKRYGVLPDTLTESDPVDPYATDRAYWAEVQRAAEAWPHENRVE